MTSGVSRVVHEVRCFGAKVGEGNRAFVILSDRSSQAERQTFARDSGVACSFLDTDGPGRFLTDYYLPHGARSPLCIHGTLAAGHVLMRDLLVDSIELTTSMKGQRLVVSRSSVDGDDSHMFVSLTRQDVPSLRSFPDVAALLNLPGFVPVSQPVVASVGSPKLLVEVSSSFVLHSLSPDLGAIVSWSKEAGVNGVYVWCHSDSSGDRIEGRNFNHLDPALEDSATGVAAGALSAVLGRDIVVSQGRETCHDNMIKTRCLESGSKILVGGLSEIIR